MAGSKIDPIALQISRNSESFPQTGSWSMVDLAKAPITGTLGALSRYHAARVDPYVAIVGETLCTIFRLTLQGRRNIDNAVEKLKVVGTLGKTLEIGFAMEDIVRVMAKTDEGRMCMGLCAALTECYTEDMAVEILLEMARLVHVEGRFMPSSQSWKDLLKACAGTLSATKFPLIAEHYMQLPKDDVRLGTFHRFDCLSDKLRSCPNPAEFAQAMFALAAITRGELKAVTIIGGNDSGWIAAVAQWFFDLKIGIFLSDGTPHHRSCDDVYHMDCNPDDAQVLIFFQNSAGEAGPNPPSFAVTGRTVIINDISELFEQEGRHYSSLIVSGRLEWKSALSTSFSLEFKKLLTLRESFGTAIGNAARLFGGLATADEFYPMKYRLACTNYCDASYGVGFVGNTLYWFPELQSIKSTMEKAVNQTLKQASKDYEASIATIRENCLCPTCTSTSTGHCIPAEADGDDLEMTPVPDLESESNDTESELDYDPDRYCLVVIVETIICLSRMLANIVLEDKNLLPTRSGFELAYSRQLTDRISAPGGMQALREIGQIAFCLDFDANFSWGPLTEGEQALDVRLKNVVSLFSGRQTYIDGNLNAVCSNGIVAFLGFLRTPDTGKEAMSRIHVIPGRITYEGKNYPKLVDQRVDSSNPFTILYASNHRGDFSRLTDLGEVASSNGNLAWIIRESSTTLECSLDSKLLCSSNDNLTDTTKFPPVGASNLVSQLSGQTGLISCRLAHRLPYSGPCKESAIFSRADIQAAIANGKPLMHNGKSILIFDCRNVKNSIAVIAVTVHLPSEYSTYIVRGECVTCCIKAALSVDREERPAFCFLLFPA
jgi:hypothetical protein